MTTYRGFSTANSRNKRFRLTDFELVKQDLMNHLMIRKGEKLMSPNFGTVIWNLLFEPLTDDIQRIIVDDLNKIVATDPRLAVDNVVVTQFEHGIQVELEVRYLQTDETSNMVVQFDQNLAR